MPVPGIPSPTPHPSPDSPSYSPSQLAATADRFIFMVLGIVGKCPRSVDDMKAQGMYIEYCVRVSTI